MKTKKKNVKRSKLLVHPKYNNTIVVNLLAGPGAGKSTMAAELFAKLKWAGVDCELAAEYAKDLVWEKRHKTFENQIYLFGKQHHRIFRLLGQVQVVITDSPLFLTPIYDASKNEFLKRLAFEEARKCDNLNIFVVRKKDYNPNGRNQTQSQSIIIDNRIKALLKDNKIPFILVDGSVQGAEYVKNLVLKSL
jgi:hypothetical protein